MKLGCVLVTLLLWTYSSHGWAPVYHSPTLHEYSGIYSVVMKRSAPLTSREFLIRSIRGISRQRVQTDREISQNASRHFHSLVRPSSNLFLVFVTN